MKKTPTTKAAKPAKIDRNGKPTTAKTVPAVVKQAAKASVKKAGTGNFDPKVVAKAINVAAKKVGAPALRSNAAPAPAVTARKVTATTAKAYLPKEERKRMLDGVITKLLKRDGLAKLTRTAVATEAGVSNSLLRVYYTNADGLKIAAVQNAVDTGDLKTARKAIADGFTASLLTRKAQTALKNAAR